MQDNKFESNELEHIRVLIADDDPIFSTIASAALNGANCTVRIATDGAAAFESVLEEKIDVAIVDLSMPDVDGFRLIAMIRSTPRISQLPIMVLTSRNDTEAIEEAYRLGANSYTTKPVNWALFPSHMRHVHKSAKTIQSLQDKAARTQRNRILQNAPKPA